MAKMGRPRIEIDKKDFEKLCGIQCTLKEISGFFECSEDTIERWCVRTYKRTFAEVWKEKAAFGQISIRRQQFKVAEKGNTSMLIWLGKQYLGQRENAAVDIESGEDTNLTVNIIAKDSEDEEV